MQAKKMGKAGATRYYLLEGDPAGFTMNPNPAIVFLAGNSKHHFTTPVIDVMDNTNLLCHADLIKGSSGLFGPISFLLRPIIFLLLPIISLVKLFFQLTFSSLTITVTNQTDNGGVIVPSPAPPPQEASTNYDEN